jgi:hypothetical protein
MFRLLESVILVATGAIVILKLSSAPNHTASRSLSAAAAAAQLCPAEVEVARYLLLLLLLLLRVVLRVSRLLCGGVLCSRQVPILLASQGNASCLLSYPHCPTPCFSLLIVPFFVFPTSLPP